MPQGRVCKCSLDKVSECRPVIIAGPKAAVVRLFNSTTIQCAVDTKGLGTEVIWLHNGATVATQTLTDDSRIISVNYTIRSVERNHSGSYACKFVNDYQNVESEVVTITVTNGTHCFPNPCDRGACVVKTNIGSESVNCDCPAGFVGPRCETDVNECASAPCLNGGTCEDLPNNYSCLCVLGYTGARCETDVLECASNPCSNSANCNDMLDGYHCDCDDGYTGTHCETEIDECMSDPCTNNATCHNLVGGYNCHCFSGYTGTHCQDGKTWITL